MQKGHILQFNCQQCQNPIKFSVFDLDCKQGVMACSKCNKVYHLEDENLRRQLRKFEMLCLQIVESEEILSDTSVGICIGDKEIKVPYKLLLARLNSTLELQVGNEKITIEFRLEPLLDMAAASKKVLFNPTGS